MTNPRLQVALDVTDLDRALYVASQVIDIADRIEVGTPLLRKHGVFAIQAIRAKFHETILVADCKIMDFGESETKLAIDAGADGVIVQAVAPTETIEAVCRTAQRLGAFAMVDCIGITNMTSLARKLNGLPLSHLIIHKSKDEQTSMGPIRARETLDLAVGNYLAPLAIAGGITAANVSELVALPQIDTLIVGEAIVSSATPQDVARSLIGAWTKELHWTT